uniref:BHLH domain-containing protein n=1 Tax=Heterorhabditis bacteriophora TaxID=37862 RepID=A0A1I7XUI6_HETBA
MERVCGTGIDDDSLSHEIVYDFDYEKDRNKRRVKRVSHNIIARAICSISAKSEGAILEHQKPLIPNNSTSISILERSVVHL